MEEKEQGMVGVVLAWRKRESRGWSGSCWPKFEGFVWVVCFRKRSIYRSIAGEFWDNQ